MFDWIGNLFKEKQYENQDVLDILFKKKTIFLESSWKLIGAKIQEISYENIYKFKADLIFSRSEWEAETGKRIVDIINRETTISLTSPKDLEILKIACKYLSQSLDKKF